MDIGKVQLLESSFQWEINNSCISQCENAGQSIESPLFYTMANAKLDWRLRLYPRGRYEHEHRIGYMSLFLVSYNESEVKVQIDFGAFVKGKEVCRYYFDFEPIAASAPRGARQFLKRSLIINEEGILIVDDLKIFCKIHANVCNDMQSYDKLRTSGMLRESIYMEHLMRDEKFSDITFVVDGQSFKVHKCILANKSPIFRTMFEFDKRNKAINEVVIEGISHEVFGEMLQYIYTVRINEIDKIADTLFEEVLMESLSIENAVKYLDLAKLHNAPNLEKRIMNFLVRQNAQELINAPEYQSIVDSTPGMVSEVLCAFMLNKPK